MGLLEIKDAFRTSYSYLESSGVAMCLQHTFAQMLQHVTRISKPAWQSAMQFRRGSSSRSSAPADLSNLGRLLVDHPFECFHNFVRLLILRMGGVTGATGIARRVPCLAIGTSAESAAGADLT